MSSKFVTSERMPSALELWKEEWVDEDLEDFEPDKSGGEFGGLMVLVISAPATLKNKIREQGVWPRRSSNRVDYVLFLILNGLRDDFRTFSCMS
jgi:hypothetical protein